VLSLSNYVCFTRTHMIMHRTRINLLIDNLGIQYLKIWELDSYLPTEIIQLDV
jgi:hypothetical protein